MKRGIMKWYDAKHAFGFIIDDVGNDVFFHKRNVADIETLETIIRETQTPHSLDYRIDETYTDRKRTRWVRLAREGKP